MQKGLLEVEKKNFLALKKELDAEVLEKLEKEFEIKYAHEAVHIEGDSVITLEQAYSLKEVSGESEVSEREQKELLNHLKAFKFVKKAVLENKKLDEDFIKDTHQLLMEDILAGGLYRRVNVGLKGLHQPPDHVKVYDRMRRMMDDLDFNFKGTDIERSAFVALTISKIHPFIDGNGRVSRLMLNYSLMKNGYLPISIGAKDRENYFAALDEFKLEKKMDKMVLLIEKLLIDRYNEINSKINEWY